ncbi:MAG: sigma-70 family RNA polymerase sigma factor [Gemmatimonadota bacterium]|nr:MAG: sigma-70 family RNA polymerase sigma factor [Gemmatimonadota bacterium]
MSMPNEVAASDQELARKAKGGQLSAFDELVLKYRKNVYAIAFRMTRNHSDADDLAQETFLRAYQALDSYKPGFEFRTWLYRIAVNASINHLKRKGRRVEMSLEDNAGLDVAASTSSYNPGTGIEEKELREKIETAIQHLPLKLRSVFLLRTFEDLTYEEIAHVLNISKGTVMSRLSRAREKLKIMLREYVEGKNE